MPKITKTYSEEEVIAALSAHYNFPMGTKITVDVGKEWRGYGMGEQEVVVFRGVKVVYEEN